MRTCLSTVHILLVRDVTMNKNCCSDIKRDKNLSFDITNKGCCGDIRKNKNLSGDKKDKNLHANERFFDRGASCYDRRIVQFWMRKFYQPAMNDIEKNGAVLDVSCGTGNLLVELASQGHTNLQGVDYSSKMVEAAGQKLSNKAVIQKGDVHQLPFPDRTFDYVVSTEAFHHYYDQSKALSELVRVTKKNGKVIVSDINFFVRPIHWLFQKVEPGCVKINSKTEMRSLFADAGLTEINQERSFLFALKTVGVK